MACVGSRPIKAALLDHWMYVAEKTSNGPGAPVIGPTDPPRFARCVAEVKRKIPGLGHIPSYALREDCAGVFAMLSTAGMNFLIHAYWYEADAAVLRINVSAALVRREFKRAFPNTRALNKVLNRTGQTVADVLFSIRVQLTHQLLLKSSGGNRAALIQALRAAFAPTTYCRSSYSVPDCGHTIGTA